MNFKHEKYDSNTKPTKYICQLERSKGLYIKYVGGGPEGFCGGHEVFSAYIDRP